MKTSGTAIFYDGKTTARHDVTVELAATALAIRDVDGSILAQWPYNEIEALAAPDGLLRLGQVGNSVLARLEVRDPTLAAAIDDRSLPVDRSGAAERRMRMKVVLWSAAAAVSLTLVAVFGLPEIAARLTPLIPHSVERKLGAAIDAQVRRELGAMVTECGTEAQERPGRGAFDKLMGKIEAAAALPIPLTVAVVREKEANAFALPGGYVYILQGLVAAAQTPDELAGVVAHEAGHVANRDGTRSVLQGAALSFLFGMLLGDFIGGGVAVYAAKTILKNTYSRAVEAEADAYSVMLMKKMGGDPRALGTILLRIAGTSHPGPRLLLDHPETKARVAAIEALSGAEPARPLLDGAEWAALKNICG
jgi:predicted Zn-dependent protease